MDLLTLARENAHHITRKSMAGLGGDLVVAKCLTDMVAEIERLQGVKRRALAIADERAIEAVRARAENERLRAALEVLLEEACAFNVSGVYFDEPCMGHKGPAMAHAALEQTAPVYRCSECGADAASNGWHRPGCSKSRM